MLGNPSLVEYSWLFTRMLTHSFIKVKGVNWLIYCRTAGCLKLGNWGWTTFDWLVYWLIDWLIDWLVDWLVNWLIDWLIDYRATGCLTLLRMVNTLLIDWLIDRLIDWLIDYGTAGGLALVRMDYLLFIYLFIGWLIE